MIYSPTTYSSPTNNYQPMGTTYFPGQIITDFPFTIGGSTMGGSTMGGSTMGGSTIGGSMMGELSNGGLVNERSSNSINNGKTVVSEMIIQSSQSPGSNTQIFQSPSSNTQYSQSPGSNTQSFQYTGTNTQISPQDNQNIYSSM